MQTASRTTFSPTISNVNDIKSLMAYCHYLVMKAQLTGNLSFDGHKPTAEENHVAEQCRVVCGKISCKLNVCRLSEITVLLDYYDICYRIGNKTLPDSTFISSQKKRVFKAWKAGDKEISESMIFGIVAPAVSYNRGSIDRDYAIAYQTLKEKWIATLKKFARFPDTTSYENYQRLALIMRENLDRELGDDADTAKRRWYESNRVNDLTTLGTQLLRSYRRFASALFPNVLDYEEVTNLDNRILSELSTRADLSPHDHQAFILALEYIKI